MLSPRLSPSHTIAALTRKFRFYERHGVEEYYLYDPESGELSGWQRHGNTLEDIASMHGWVSPRLGVRFAVENDALWLYRPDGERFATYVELMEQKSQEHQRAEQEHQRAERLAAQLRALGVDPDAAEADSV